MHHVHGVTRAGRATLVGRHFGMASCASRIAHDCWQAIASCASLLQAEHASLSPDAVVEHASLSPLLHSRHCFRYFHSQAIARGAEVGAQNYLEGGKTAMHWAAGEDETAMGSR